MALIARSEGFKGSKLTLPLRITEPSLVEWEWTVVEGPEMTFSAAFAPNADGSPFVHGMNVNTGVKMLIPQPGSSVPPTRIPLLEPCVGASDKTAFEIDGIGDLSLSWDAPPAKWPFAAAEAKLKYMVSIRATSEIRKEVAAKERADAIAASKRNAKVAELRAHETKQVVIGDALREQCSLYESDLAKISPELASAREAYEEQVKVTEAAMAALEALRPPLEALELQNSQTEALLAAAQASAANAEAWARQHREESEKYRTGEWVFQGWQGGGAPPL